VPYTSDLPATIRCSDSGPSLTADSGNTYSNICGPLPGFLLGCHRHC
jgi:hypothetical protein